MIIVTYNDWFLKNKNYIQCDCWLVIHIVVWYYFNNLQLLLCLGGMADELRPRLSPRL